MKLERNSGILLHPTSLPDSPVCGSFGKPARQWLNELADSGIGVWQFLPLAPTDSFGSPYSSPSSFAFNPWFLDQNDLVRDGFLAKNLISSMFIFVISSMLNGILYNLLFLFHVLGNLINE